MILRARNNDMSDSLSHVLILVTRKNHSVGAFRISQEGKETVVA